MRVAILYVVCWYDKNIWMFPPVILIVVKQNVANNQRQSLKSACQCSYVISHKSQQIVFTVLPYSPCPVFVL
jgi:hypothetical protein